MRRHNYGLCRKCGKIHIHHALGTHPPPTRIGPHSQETKDHISNIAKNNWKNEKFRNKMLIALRSELRCSKISKAQKGRVRSIEEIENDRMARIGKKNSQKSKEKVSLTLKNLYYLGIMVPAKGMLGKHQTDYQKKTVSETQKRNWKNRDYVDKWLKTNRIFPNKLESTFLQFLKENKLPYIYSGNISTLSVAGKLPDFIDIENRKKIIELYGDYFHKGENPQDRINYFKENGYDCLVIWEHEFSNLNDIYEKVWRFTYD